MKITEGEVKKKLEAAIGQIERATQPDLDAMLEIVKPLVNLQLKGEVPGTYNRFVEYFEHLQHRRGSDDAPDEVEVRDKLGQLTGGLYLTGPHLPPVDTDAMQAALNTYTIPDPRHLQG